ncbi:AAA family ATPase [Nannocystis punicea]|uniref:AAA family ATPase n=1 Tax=Nannocystis punicea TaxID=2995304 RepID=A0ABY7HDD2_9BACT|nr:AAA family ATPase [Nannocystis poenicansa]WAS97296.1 AAA family ATPase [Nannocystis poenicansa]
MRVLITGASGSGTTTLARALSGPLGSIAVDADDYYWLPTDPPYRQKRAPDVRLRMILVAVDAAPNAVVSGSVVGWGAEIEDSFDLIVFLYLDAAIRIERLRAREIEVLGSADPEFLDWAAAYDEGPPSGRSLAKHRAWLAERSCPVLRLEGDLSVEERARRVLDAVARLATGATS